MALASPMIADYERVLGRRSNTEAMTSDESPSTRMMRVLRELGDKWAKRFSDQAREMTDRLISRTDRYSKNSLNNSLREMSGGLTIKTPDMPATLYDRLLAATKENVALIKSVQADYHKRIEGAVMRSISSGGQSTKTLFDEIEKTGQVTTERAELIAVDQTRKINTAMNSERMKSAGLEKFEWIHSGGGKEPRQLHLDYDGQVFDLNDPPVIDERTGERGLPGQLINCRCRMRPIVDFTQYLDDAND